MDHHCPWTANCVSQRTFPHFIRFLLYACLSMTHLSTFLYTRLASLFASRSQPSYLGPTVTQLGILFVLCVANFLTLFAVGVIFIRAVWALMTNTTSIEGWEIERHEALVRRARKRGGWVEGPGGQRVWVRKQEFPYDVGFGKNLVAGMGHEWWAWLWPVAGSGRVECEADFEINDFEGEWRSVSPRLRG